MIGIIVSVSQTLNLLSNSGGGGYHTLTSDIGLGLFTLLAGALSALVGLILILIALFGLKYRAKWFFWFLIIYEILLMNLYPIGTALGLIMLIYTLARKREFFPPVAAVTSGSL